MKATFSYKSVNVKNLKRGTAIAAIAILGLIGMQVVVAALAPRPPDSAAVATSNVFAPDPSYNQRLYELNEMLYPSDVSHSQQRLYTLNEQLYPSSARATQAQRLQSLNEMLYPSDSATTPSRNQRLMQLNESLYPSRDDASTFWSGRPH